MAVIENRATEAGDVLVIKTTVPVVGIVALLSFMDTTSGETTETYFQKTFRYSRDGGMSFSEWMELTTINVQGIIIEKIDYFIIEFRYKRIGTEGELAFSDVTLEGTYEPLNYTVFNNSIFSEFFTPNSAPVLEWALNVLEKLYRQGIVPNYVTRGKQSSDDRDYIAYWFTVTHFFAILVYFARQFESIQTNTLLMREFVKGRGIYMRCNPSIDELQYIFDNYISELQDRGTKQIYRKSGELLRQTPITYYYGEPIGGELIYADADGELRRLLDNLTTDELIFAYTTRGELGWCIGRSSPLYMGADGIMNLIKGYEFGEDVEDLEKYPLVNSDYIMLQSGKIQITGLPNNAQAGIGVEGSFSTLGSKALVVDPSLSYEISFKVTKTENAIEDLTFGVALFDENGISVSPTRITDGYDDALFFEQKTLNKADVEYWVRGVLHAYNTLLIPTDVLTIGFGQGLRMRSNVRYLVPIILVENYTGSTLTDVIQIRDVKIRPAQLWFSRGLLSARNLIIGFLKNRNVELNNSQVEKIINEELIPYNTFTMLKFL